MCYSYVFICNWRTNASLKDATPSRFYPSTCAYQILSPHYCSWSPLHPLTPSFAQLTSSTRRLSTQGSFFLPATLLAWDPFRFWVPTCCSRYLALKPMWNCMRFAWATIVHIEDSRSLHIARIAWFDWLVQAKHVLRRVVSMRIVTRLHALVSFP